MYFPADVARGIVARIARSMPPGGYLFLGHAETLRGISEGFHLRHTHDTFYYQRRGAHEPRPADPAPSGGAVSVPEPPALAGSGESWFDVIGRATERIAALARPPERPGSAPEPARRGRDLGGILDLVRRERFADAMEALDSLPAEPGADLDAELLRAAIQTNAGNLAGAKETCRRILGADEMNAGARYLLALCLEHEGDRAGAAEQDRAAAYLDPAFAMPRLHLGLLARRQGNADAARRELEEALSLLDREDASRILLFGGGFSRDALVELCRRELKACGAPR
jgi:chemotaxis protein methyltransferase CheR